MAKSLKGARKIVIGDVTYRWRAMGHDGWISLTIWPESLAGPTIACSLDYHQVPVPAGPGLMRLTRQIVVTNRVVRRVIEHAISDRSYDPSRKGRQLNLRDLDSVVDLSDAVRAE